MSYEIAKSITVKGSKTKIVCRSNNVFPSHYWDVELVTNYDALLRDLDSGCLQPTESANGYKWSYIDLMLQNYEGEERKAMFIRYVNEVQPKGKYLIKTDRGFVYKITKNRVWFTYDRKLAKPFGYYEAVVKSKRLSYTYGAHVTNENDAC